MKSGFDVLWFCRVYMRLQSDLPIPYGQLRVLYILCETPGPHTPMMLADVLRVSRPMVAAHINALLDGGYVTRVASPEDGRSVYILCTKKGRALIEKTNRGLLKINEKLSQKMGAKKFETFCKLTNQASAILSE